MNNPQLTLSYPILAGAVMALSALRAGSRVMVVLSGESPGEAKSTAGFVRNETEVLEVLTDYLGTGYSFGIHRLRDGFGDRKPTDRPAHVIVVSDSDIFSILDATAKHEKGWSVAPGRHSRRGGADLRAEHAAGVARRGAGAHEGRRLADPLRPRLGGVGGVREGVQPGALCGQARTGAEERPVSHPKEGRVMQAEGPLLEVLTRRLAETPADFLAEPLVRGKGVVDVAAVVADLLRDLGGDAARRLRRPPAPAEEDARPRARLAARRAGDGVATARPLVPRRGADAAAIVTFLNEPLRGLTRLVPPAMLTSDANRREELARLTLGALGLRAGRRDGGSGGRPLADARQRRAAARAEGVARL